MPATFRTGNRSKKPNVRPNPENMDLFREAKRIWLPETRRPRDARMAEWERWGMAAARKGDRRNAEIWAELLSENNHHWKAARVYLAIGDWRKAAETFAARADSIGIEPQKDHERAGDIFLFLARIYGHMTLYRRAAEEYGKAGIHNHQRAVEIHSFLFNEAFTREHDKARGAKPSNPIIQPEQSAFDVAWDAYVESNPYSDRNRRHINRFED